MNRRAFLRALAAGSVAAVIGEAPRALAPRFFTGGLIRPNARMVLPGPCSVLTPRAMATLGIPSRRALAAWKADKAMRVTTIVIELAPRVVESIARRDHPAVRVAMAAVARAQAAIIEAEPPPWADLSGERVVARWKG